MKIIWPRSRSISIRMFSSFALLFLVAVVAVSILSYTFAAKVLEQQVMDANQQMMKHVATTIDLSLKAIEKDVFTLSLSTSVKEYLRSEPFLTHYTPQQLDAFYNVIKELNTDSGVSVYPYEVLLYSQNHGTIVGSSYNNRVAYEYISQLPQNVWIVEDGTASTTHDPCLWYIHKVFPPITNYDAFFVLQITIDAMRELWAENSTYRMYVMDSLGAFISAPPANEKLQRAIQAEDSLFYRDGDLSVSVYFGDNGWRYIRETPLSQEFAALTGVRNSILLLTFGLTLISLLVVYKNSTRISKPFKAIALDLAKNRHEKPIDEVKAIRNFIEDLQEKHQQLDALVSDYSEQLDNERALRILKTPVPTQEQIEDFLASSQSINKQFCTLLLQVDDAHWFETSLSYEKREFIRLTIFKRIYQLFESVGICSATRMDELRIGVIINADMLSVEKLVEGCERLTQEIQRTSNLSISIAIGAVVESPRLIYQSYNQALRTIELRFHTGYGHVYTDHDVKQQVIFPQVSARYVANIITQDQTMIRQYLIDPLKAAIQDKYVDLRFLHAWTSSLLLRLDSALREAYSALYKPGIDQSTLLESIYAIETQQQLFGLLNHTIGLMRKQLMQREKAVHPHIQDILTYINENISENFSLTDAAEAVGLNPSYASTLFKQETGEAFVSYIQRTRIDTAKQMIIAQPGTTLEIIGRNVGFLNSHTFIRTFKKLEGITPGQYKANIRRNIYI